MTRNVIEEEKAFSKIALNLRNLKIGESMNLTAQLIDDIVQIYWNSLKRKYPGYRFEELIKIGHKELFLNERRSDY